MFHRKIQMRRKKIVKLNGLSLTTLYFTLNSMKKKLFMKNE
jgi:hypothetical protein